MLEGVPENENELSEWLTQLRELRDLSQKEAGHATGTSERSVRRWENGDVPNGLDLLRLLSAYGVRWEPEPPEGAPKALNAEILRMYMAVDDLGVLLVEILHRVEDKLDGLYVLVASLGDQASKEVAVELERINERSAERAAFSEETPGGFQDVERTRSRLEELAGQAGSADDPQAGEIRDRLESLIQAMEARRAVHRKQEGAQKPRTKRARGKR